MTLFLMEIFFIPLMGKQSCTLTLKFEQKEQQSRYLARKQPYVSIFGYKRTKEYLVISNFFESTCFHFVFLFQSLNKLTSSDVTPWHIYYFDKKFCEFTCPIMRYNLHKTEWEPFTTDLTISLSLKLSFLILWLKPL